MTLSLDDQLPANFPQEFLPERRLLSRLLHYAQTGASGDKIAISEATDIPTGKSSGKVEPTIHYARGMGLLKADKRAGKWHFQLTSLGIWVFQEDPYLQESVTIWVLHLMLCRRLGRVSPAQGVADPWFSLFAEGTYRLGTSFTHRQFLEQLEARYGQKGYLKSLSALVLRSYLEQSSLGVINVIQGDDGNQGYLYKRLEAPRERDFHPAYAVYFFHLWDGLFHGDRQVSLDEFFEETRFLYVVNWAFRDALPLLSWMTDKGLLEIDQQTGKPLALRVLTSDATVKLLYSELM